MGKYSDYEKWEKFLQDENTYYYVSTKGRVKRVLYDKYDGNTGRSEVLEEHYYKHHVKQGKPIVNVKYRRYIVANLMAKCFMAREVKKVGRFTVKYKDNNPLNLNIDNFIIAKYSSKGKPDYIVKIGRKRYTACTHKEIAELTGFTLGTVRWQMCKYGEITKGNIQVRRIDEG